MRTTPTKRSEWVKEGDDCVSPAGMRGKVLRIISGNTGLPSVKVLWENGYTGRITITLLVRDPK